MMLIRHEENI